MNKKKKNSWMWYTIFLYKDAHNAHIVTKENENNVFLFVKTVLLLILLLLFYTRERVVCYIPREIKNK